MKEFMRKFDTREKASDLFVRLAEELKKEEAALSLAPINIPPRPTTQTKTSTCKAISTQNETSKSPSESLISEVTPVIPSTQPEPQFFSPTVPPSSTGDEGVEAREGDAREKKRDGGETGGDDREEGTGNENEGDREFDEKWSVGDESRGDRTGEDVVDKTEIGEKSEDVDREIPNDEVVEGEIPTGDTTENTEEEGCVEGEIPEELKGDVREEEIVEGDDEEDDGTEKVVDMDVDGPKLSDRPELTEATKIIVVLEEGPELEDTPATERTNRRNTRRSKKLDWTRTSTRARRLNLVDSESEEEAGDNIPENLEMPKETGEDIP
ncbi:uncharacterized protein LOC121796897 [Salvia splendens]|uniref:uncharacterized protein LOC121796897 n=1 Tax=Salvia splendens TaxID=180675 RepID=UPI001C272353|nr:uncharacterized protein LOC121796897 [Salvia splendens]